ncbi:hypothetical protein P175DRAFT_0521662 [Aspergillus ochraceoroseus IBT 24754]|uniref:Uncharacterized protein n=2 Tax=Aspergillus ochraceoroseus TaxID=138278 RepID=A0A2T5M1V6_9EURO|nr:uncharacterized protein P175DRAFT_0521662 [Aspergillus ochraceoroseus IBT 24754]KKK24879.1 hypothetical protein AOCH_007078 [Aspergillus ochraceoroseus]PTU22511.1 hypothetical protein P175DRAFT_0521662 [Aspergillus ochraceoroseus IBT 24754]
MTAAAAAAAPVPVPQAINENILEEDEKVSIPGCFPDSTTILVSPSRKPNTTTTTTTNSNSNTSHKKPLIQASPYPEPDHLLDLTTLDRQPRLLAKALTTLTNTRADYATAPYAESFNWDTVFQTLQDLANSDPDPEPETEPETETAPPKKANWTPQSFYVVVFRSVLRETADLDLLYRLDFESHREAVESGGLLKYWFGVRNERRENLATCIWRSRHDARVGGTGPWHKKARGAARELYEGIEFTTLELVVGGSVGEWELRDWVEHAV